MQDVSFYFKTDNLDVEIIKESIINEMEEYFNRNSDILDSYDCDVDQIELDSSHEDDWQIIHIGNIILDDIEEVMDILVKKDFTNFYLKLESGEFDPVYFTISDDELIDGNSLEEIGLEI